MQKITLDNNKKFKYESGEHIFFTSDTHFHHTNILRFCNRSFKTVQEMDEELIKRWNEKVGPDDIVYHLGDFAWGGSEVWNSIIPRLNGHIHLIVGNHDEKNLRQGYMHYFESVEYQQHIYVEGKSIYLNHYPFLTFGGVYRGKESCWQLFGHVHTQKGSSGKDKGRLQYLFPTQYDVGVDNNDYAPVSFAEVKVIIEEQQRIANMRWWERVIDKIFVTLKIFKFTKL